ncbi:MAG: CDP-diacylglycerol--serine O-phosphatidyltransferase [Candidatus Zhuqueibacterota bacterium]
MKNKRQVIPNLFTTLNIFWGFLAIISTMEGKIITACWLIALSAICDALDGQLARLTKSSSDFGIEFDSLADIVSFGVAPSIVFYKAYFFKLGILGIILSFLPLVFGGIRLARFNVIFGGKEKTKFVGLPIPYMAMTLSSFIIFNYHFWGELYLSRIIIPQLLLVCLLMISTVEYYTAPKATFRHSTKNSIGIILLMITAVILALFPHETFYPINVIYIVWGIIRFVYRLTRGNDHEKTIEIIAP